MVKKLHLGGTILVCLLLSACGKQVESVAPTVTATASQIPNATQTSVPTETAVPTPSFTPIVIPTAAPPSVVMPFSGIYAPRIEENLLVLFDGPQGMFEEIYLPNDGRVDWLRRDCFGQRVRSLYRPVATGGDQVRYPQHRYHLVQP